MTEFAMLFPGQGSQSVGMLSALAEAFPAVQETFSEGSEVLGLDLWELVSQGPESRLGKTELTQPALLAAGVAVWRCWKEAGGGNPEFMAGHSLGEYTALVCAEALTYRDAIGLVADRGRFMQAAVPEGQGAMAAILGLDDGVIEELCQSLAGEQVVSPANFNSPGQVVIAGHAEAVSKVSDACQEAGARRVMALAVSVPSHCALMKPAARDLQARLEQVNIRPPAIPVIHNVDVAARSEPDAIRAALADQLVAPVRWTQTVLDIQSRGVEQMAECGPGRVLSGLCRRIERGLTCKPLETPDGLKETALEWSQI